MALTSFFGLVNNTDVPIEVRTDNQEVIESIRNFHVIEKDTNPKLYYLMEFLQSLPVKINFTWTPIYGNKSIKLAEDLIKKEIEKVGKSC
jgi:hypothetical protein